MGHAVSLLAPAPQQWWTSRYRLAARMRIVGTLFMAAFDPKQTYRLTHSLLVGGSNSPRPIKFPGRQPGAASAQPLSSKPRQVFRCHRPKILAALCLADLRQVTYQSSELVGRQLSAFSFLCTSYLPAAKQAFVLLSQTQLVLGGTPEFENVAFARRRSRLTRPSNR